MWRDVCLYHGKQEAEREGETERQEVGRYTTPLKTPTMTYFFHLDPISVFRTFPKQYYQVGRKLPKLKPVGDIS